MYYHMHRDSLLEMWDRYVHCVAMRGDTGHGVRAVQLDDAELQDVHEQCDMLKLRQRVHPDSWPMPEHCTAYGLPASNTLYGQL
jgi:hypothetical protein